MLKIMLHIGVDPYGDLDYQHFDNQEDFWEGCEKAKLQHILIE